MERMFISRGRVHFSTWGRWQHYDGGDVSNFFRVETTTLIRLFVCFEEEKLRRLFAAVWLCERVSPRLRSVNPQQQRMSCSKHNTNGKQRVSRAYAGLTPRSPFLASPFRRCCRLLVIRLTQHSRTDFSRTRSCVSDSFFGVRVRLWWAASL